MQKLLLLMMFCLILALFLFFEPFPVDSDCWNSINVCCFLFIPFLWTISLWSQLLKLIENWQTYSSHFDYFRCSFWPFHVFQHCFMKNKFEVAKIKPHCICSMVNSNIDHFLLIYWFSPILWTISDHCLFTFLFIPMVWTISRCFNQ